MNGVLTWAIPVAALLILAVVIVVAYRRRDSLTEPDWTPWDQRMADKGLCAVHYDEPCDCTTAKPAPTSDRRPVDDMPPATTDDVRTNLNLVLDRWPTPTGDPNTEVDPAALRAAEIAELDQPDSPPLTPHEREVADALIQTRKVDDRRTQLGAIARGHESLLPADADLRARVWEWPTPEQADAEPDHSDEIPVSPRDSMPPSFGQAQRINGSDGGKR